MTIFQTIVLAIIEGLTEFLPISSTGHMVLVSSYFGIEEDDFVKLFEVVIQLGAILAVVAYYYKKFFIHTQLKFYYKLIVAVIPALILGALFDKKIDALLESPLIIGTMLFIGGVFLLFIDKMFTNHIVVEKEENLGYKKSFIIGIWQCVAMIPGVSRSAASIIGGMQQKLTRNLAVEFSFFLAVPTMCAATGYKLFKAMKNTPEILNNSHNLWLLGIGNLIAFIVALLAIKFFISYIQKYGFKLFGYYRIALGIVVFVYFLFVK